MTPRVDNSTATPYSKHFPQKTVLVIASIFLIAFGGYYNSELYGIVSMGAGGAFLLSTILWIVKGKKEVTHLLTQPDTSKWVATWVKNPEPLREKLTGFLPFAGPLINIIVEYCKKKHDVVDETHWLSVLGLTVSPLIDEGIDALLQVPCPFWPDQHVIDTHMVVAMPLHWSLHVPQSGKIFSGVLTLNKYSQSYATKGHLELSLAHDEQLGAPQIVLMTRQVIPGSPFSESLQEQANLLAEVNKNFKRLDDDMLGSSVFSHPYNIPTPLQATVCMTLMHEVDEQFFSSGQHLTICNGENDAFNLHYSFGGNFTLDPFFRTGKNGGLRAVRVIEPKG